MWNYMTMPAVEASGLTKRYGRRMALADCDLVIPEGAVVGLVGPNGAGKSTLLQLACGLVTPTGGSLQVVGANPARDTGHLSKVGFVAQEAPVYPTLTVADHLKLGRKMNPRWDQGLAERRLARLDLDPRQKAGALSGGQRAQLALAVAAAKRPELLILDEPAAALDPLARQAFMDGLVELVEELGTTAILSSHLLEDVERVCNWLVVLHRGRLQIAGSAAALTAEHLRLSDEEAARAGVAVEVITRTATGLIARRRDGASLTGGGVRLTEIVVAYLARAEGDPSVSRATVGEAR